MCARFAPSVSIASIARSLGGASSCALASASLLVLAASDAPRAQGQVWVVAPNAAPGVDFTSLRAAIQTVASGDTLLVKPGTYDDSQPPLGPTTISAKSIALQADGGPVSWLNDLRIEQLLVGQHVVMRGIAQTAGYTAAAAALEIADCFGDVWIEELSVPAPALPFVPSGPSIRVSNSIAVALSRLSVQGGDTLLIGGAVPGGPALTVESSLVAVYDSQLRGGKGNDTLAFPFVPAGSGYPGIEADSGELYLTNVSTVGGAGGNVGFPTSPGTCFTPGDGSNGLLLASPGALVFGYGVALAGGAHGSTQTAGCPDGLDGAPYAAAAGQWLDLPSPARSFQAASPVREGQSLALSFTGAPGALCFAAVSALDGFLYVPALAGVLLLGQPVLTVFQGVLAPSGQLQLSVPIHELGPGTEAVWLRMQGVVWSANDGPLLAGASAVLLLDQAF